MAAADPTVRAMSARLAALTRWSKEPDPTAATAPARRGLRAKFEREIDPDGTLRPAELAARVDRMVHAHMLRMSMAARAKRMGAAA